MNTCQNQMIFRSIWHLSTRGIQEKYHLPWIRRPTWSLALISNFNTPSQLGRTPSANPSARLYYLCHQCPALLCSALLNHEEEELIENVSYHSLLTQSQSHMKRVCHTTLTNPRSVPKVSFITLTDPKSVSLIPDQYHKRVSQATHTDPKSVSLILDQYQKRVS